MYRKFVKRLLDIIFSALAVILLTPVFAVIALAVRIKMGRPVMFVQNRIGKDEKLFSIIKFRTMTSKTDKNGELLPDEQRKTKLGLFLRSTSLDELPELFNILKGDLSFVGPRSLLPEYLPFYTESEKIRHSVRGGLTPPEVLHNDFTPTWEKQFEYEAEYVKNLSFMLDVKIFFATISGVFKRKKLDYGSYVRKPLNEERGEGRI